MSSYNLTIQIPSDVVGNLHAAGQKVAIVKEVGNSSGTQVIWVCFLPFENNQVSWESEYGVYASNTLVQEGATINKISAVDPASAGLFYPFVNDIFGSPITPGPGNNNYGIVNESSQEFTFGMAQSVSANGNPFSASPLNAVSVRSNQKVFFTPTEIVKVFFSGNFNEGQIIRNIPGEALTVDLTNNPNPTIKFDWASGTFIPA